MKRALKITASIAGLGLVLSGCATQSVSSFQPFQAEDLNTAVKSGLLVQKTDNLYVIVDSSSSMSAEYQGEGYPSGQTKLSVEKEVLNRLNQSIPDIQLNTAIRSFGFGPCLDWGSTKLNKSLGAHSKADFNSGISSLECSSGGSPINAALNAAKEDLAASSGNISILILSDGHNLDASPVSAAKALEDQYGSKLCIYSVWVGNEKESGGRFTLQQLSDIAGCGYATSAKAVASATGMSDLVEGMIFDRAEITAEPDSDGDGVPDSIDKCPNTPKGAKVDETGCWIYHGVFFDFNKATIKPEFQPLFDNALEVLELNPDLVVEVIGHTDSIGPAAYNQKLSVRRAQAVKDYLVKHGVDPKRLIVKGKGESEPARSNDTEAGRAFNRRVEFKRPSGN
ncbi:OmpA family protein [Thiolapillus sp.]|uniref:OmpA family protein n=1 Tax=Thiolapillus sp. TaxID=2017437 RepID=UPI003AF9DBA5